MNLSVRRRLLQSLASYERDVRAAQARAEARRRAAWSRLAELRSEQARFDLKHYCPPAVPSPTPPPEVSAHAECEEPVPVEWDWMPRMTPSATATAATTPDATGQPQTPQTPPSTAPGPVMQGRPRRLRDGVSGIDPSPDLSIWARLGKDD